MLCVVCVCLPYYINYLYIFLFSDKKNNIPSKNLKPGTSHVNNNKEFRVSLSHMSKIHQYINAYDKSKMSTIIY